MPHHDRPGAELPPPTPGAAALRSGATRAIDLPVLAAIAAGGGVGTVARHAVDLAVDDPSGVFPWATFAVNATGSFALGLALIVLLERFPRHRHLLPFLATGVLGSFTTYSTFAVQTDLLVRDGRPVVALAYAVSSLGAGLAGAGLGIRAGRSTPPRRTNGRDRRSGTGDGGSSADDGRSPGHDGKRRDT